MTLRFLFGAILLALPWSALAQDSFTVGTIERKPFSFKTEAGWAGFSIDLLEEVGARMDWEYNYVEHDTFVSLLDSVRGLQADMAAANISITASREADMDFSQPIFDAGLIVLTPLGGKANIFSILFSRDLLLWVGGAILVLLGAGALITRFEGRRDKTEDHDYGDGKIGSVGEGIWWAVNVVTQAGFEIPSPRTRGGRLLAFSLILTGLFAVSAFVAQITASLTISELTSQVDGYNDLHGKRVGTTAGSTSAQFLDEVRIGYTGYASLNEMFEALEAGDLDAVVHDAPILAYYSSHEGYGRFELVGRIFKREKYGIAMIAGHRAKEEMNQTILQLREDGTYDALVAKWFGADY